MSAAEIRARIPEVVWNSYYKFCFERNPWDRVISYYYWKHRKGPRPALSDFVHSERLGKLRKQGRDLYTIGGEVVVDRVCRFEALDGELAAVCRKLGMPWPLELPRAKGGFRRDRRNYRDLLGERERQRIAEFFHDEITRLGYEF
jgi:hypothetical protein